MLNKGFVRLLAALGMISLVVGCGGGSGEQLVQVHGTLTNAGQPLEVEGRDVGLGIVRVDFYEIDENGVQTTDPQPGLLAPDRKSYTVPGRSGNGLPVGKYRIVVRQWDPFPDFDRLEGRFDEQNSPIIREITEDTEINIDVSRPEG